MRAYFVYEVIDVFFFIVRIDKRIFSSRMSLIVKEGLVSILINLFLQFISERILTIRSCFF